MDTTSRDGKARTPCTILTGFLGAGKTTLVNHILRGKEHGIRVAVIENEFGEVGVDDALLETAMETEEEVFEMNNGCICCTVRGDLLRIFERLSADGRRFDHILIETTGLADPAPVAQTFFVDDRVKSMYALDAIVTVVDARHIMQHLKEEKPDGVENEAVEQVRDAARGDRRDSTSAPLVTRGIDDEMAASDLDTRTHTRTRRRFITWLAYNLVRLVSVFARTRSCYRSPSPTASS